MVTPARILGLALIGLVGTLCLLSTVGAAAVAGATLLAVTIDALRQRTRRRDRTERIVVVDLSSR